MNNSNSMMQEEQRLIQPKERLSWGNHRGTADLDLGYTFEMCTRFGVFGHRLFTCS
jgi:hypothetical protein